MRRKLVIISASVLAMFSVSSFASGVAVIDMQKIFTSAPEVKQINDQLKTQFATRKASIDEMSKTVQTDMQSYQKNKSVMSKESLTQLEQKITGEQQKLQQAGMQFQKDVYTAQSTKTKAFLAKVKQIVQTIAVKKDLDVVLPKGALLYSKSDLDITSDVISELKE